MDDEPPKSVLVCLSNSDHRREISFSGDLTNLEAEVRRVFGDLCPKHEMFFQIKHEGWGGRFVDVTSVEEICNKSVLNVVVEGNEVNL